MARAKISLIGGGQIGGNLALLAAQKELGDIVIFDIPKAEGMVKGKALDLMQLKPHDGYDANISGTSDWKDLTDSDVFIITAGLPRKPGMDREDLLEINLGIMTDVAENIKEYSPNAFVIVVSNPLDAMVYAFYKVSQLKKNMVVGMAGALDSARFRAFIAMEVGCSVQDVTCMVLGGHGDTMVPITRFGTVGGVPIESLINPDRLEEIVNRTRFAGGEIVKLFGNGSAFYAPAQSAIEMAESYLRDKKRIIPCASLCEGEFGINGYFIGVPSVIGSGGVENILEFSLTEEEKFELKNTLEAVKKTAKDFINARKSDRIGILVFAGESFIQCPLTIDKEVLLALMDDIQVAEQSYDGTAIGMAIANATNRLRNSDAKSKVMILLSDGSNNAGELDPLTSADLASNFDIKIYTIGAGTNQDVSFIPGRGYIRNEIDEVTLKSIANRTNGKYFRATNVVGLEDVYKTIDELERTEIEIKEFTRYKELFGWLLIPAMIIGLGGHTIDRTIFRKQL